IIGEMNSDYAAMKEAALEQYRQYQAYVESLPESPEREEAADRLCDLASDIGDIEAEWRAEAAWDRQDAVLEAGRTRAELADEGWY
ncbi:hypothetical protein OFB92_31760, partial [Escherichia coli]|nr:hypothetical protein [Escherichia coli]